MENYYGNHLRFALYVLKEHKHYAHFSKCEFLFRSVGFLGHIICGKDVEVYPKKMDAVKKFPRPLIPTDIKSLLGLSRYNRRFID